MKRRWKEFWLLAFLLIQQSDFSGSTENSVLDKSGVVECRNCLCRIDALGNKVCTPLTQSEDTDGSRPLSDWTTDTGHKAVAAAVDGDNDEHNNNICSAKLDQVLTEVRRQHSDMRVMNKRIRKYERSVRSAAAVAQTAPVQQPCPVQTSDCDDIFRTRAGRTRDGVHAISAAMGLDNRLITRRVQCRMKANGGWTVIQRRLDGSADFYRPWQEYKRGFGEPEGEYWLGNDAIHYLTHRKPYRLRVEITLFDNKTYWAEYDSFRISDEFEGYQLKLGSFVNGNAGDSLSVHNKHRFSTFDRDNDSHDRINCAEMHHGGWWYADCYASNLNGVYRHDGSCPKHFDCVQWSFRLSHTSAKHTTMMIKADELAQPAYL